MPANAQLTFSFAGFPAGFCWPADPSVYALALTQALQGNLPGNFSTFNYGITTPAAEDQDKPWFRLFADGSPDRWYVYFSGVWCAPHAILPGEAVRWLYVGPLAQLVTFDGGSAGAVSDTTGPMWEEDTLFQGRSPMGPGLIPNSDPAKTLANQEDYGDGSHKQIESELFPHQHNATNIARAQATGEVGNPLGNLLGTPGNDLTGVIADTFPTVVQTAQNMVHPVHGVYIIKRSLRLFYTV